MDIAVDTKNSNAQDPKKFCLAFNNIAANFISSLTTPKRDSDWAVISVVKLNNPYRLKLLCDSITPGLKVLQKKAANGAGGKYDNAGNCNIS